MTEFLEGKRFARDKGIEKGGEYEYLCGQAEGS
jgi:hypothetical protein